MQVSRAVFLPRTSRKVFPLRELFYSPNSHIVATMFNMTRRLCFHSRRNGLPPPMQAFRQPFAQTYVRFIRRILRCNRAVSGQHELRNLYPVPSLRAVGHHVANVNVVSSNLIARFGEGPTATAAGPLSCATSHAPPRACGPAIYVMAYQPNPCQPVPTSANQRRHALQWRCIQTLVLQPCCGMLGLRRMIEPDAARLKLVRKRGQIGYHTA